MKKIILLFILSYAFTSVKAQVPKMLSYQGVARNAAGQPMPNQAVGIRISILDTANTVEYIGVYCDTTDALGLFTLKIGSVNPAQFDTINWVKGDHFIKTEMDPTGCSSSNYTLVGTQQLLSVPYALQSKQAAGLASNTSDLIVYTNGNLPSNERIRVTQGGPIVSNRTSPYAGDVFSVYGTGYPGAINPLGDYAINGYVSGTGAAIYGEQTSTGVGVYGNNTAGGVGVYGISATSYGVIGMANGTNLSGVRGFNTNATGSGIIGLGNNITPGSIITGGCGVGANGTSVGVCALGTNTVTGTGVVTAGNGSSSFSTLVNGSGIAATAKNIGVYGYATDTTSSALTFGGYFESNGGSGSYSYVGGRSGGTNYKITGNGVVSTIVKDLNDNPRNMFAPESPEVLFIDYGKGQLQNGFAHITLDPILAKNIYTDATHPIKVFIQLNGNCNGVYVTNETINGFDVIELNGGSSNTSFFWQFIANRADEKDANGNITSAYSTLRFPTGPSKLPSKKIESIQIKDEGIFKRNKK